jgi:hypothetical protein
MSTRPRSFAGLAADASNPAEPKRDVRILRDLSASVRAVPNNAFEPPVGLSWRAWRVCARGALRHPVRGGSTRALDNARQFRRSSPQCEATW